jgi:hypothetical protein
MLIKVFGIWLMTSNITFLQPDIMSQATLLFSSSNSAPKNCQVWFSMGGDLGYKSFNKTCDEVGKEINKKLAVN